MDEDDNEQPLHGLSIEAFKDDDGGWIVQAESCDHLTPQDVLLALNAIGIAMRDIHEAAVGELAGRN